MKKMRMTTMMMKTQEWGMKARIAMKALAAWMVMMDMKQMMLRYEYYLFLI